MKKSLPFALQTTWMGLSGESIFENEAVAVVSDSNMYNFRELGLLVQGKAETEAELIGLLYINYGYQLFEKIEGLFALTVVDKSEQKMIVATDRFGTKPIYYFSNGNYFIFGSRIRDISSMPQADIGEISYESLIDYINLSAIPTPRTIFKSVNKLRPGHFLVIDRDNMNAAVRQYYDIEYSIENESENHFLSLIPHYIEKSVNTVIEYESSKGRSIGAFLSGGTDSSTIAGMIKKLSGNVKTFSIGFDEPGYNELRYARIAAKHFGSEHHEYLVTPEDVLNTLDTIIDVYDEPFGNASAIPTYYCAKLAREHGVDTLLAGDGGDEIFGGNERYASNDIFKRYHKVPYIVRKSLLEPLISRFQVNLPLFDKARRYIRRANIPQPDRFFSYNPVMTLGIDTIFSPDMLNRANGYDPMKWARELYSGVKAWDELNKLLYIDMKFTITDNDLRKVTSMSEKASIRVGYPMLDYKLVDFAAKIPPSMKVKGKKLRYAFKKAFTDFLPSEIIYKKKHGFGLPVGIWLKSKENLSSFARETLTSHECSIRPLLNTSFINELFALHKNSGTAFYGDIIWLLLILELWNKNN